MEYRKSVAAIVFADLTFLFILGCSGLIGGLLGEILYPMAFILPFAAVTASVKVSRKSGVRLGIKREHALEFIPLIFPSISVILLVSVSVSVILSGLGLENNVTIYQSLGENLLRHALLPTVLEELLFRYLPLRLLARYSKRRAVLLSSLLFAFIHCNLFQIPYAFLAGIVLSAACLAYDSIIPSLILHLINNTVSVLLLYYDLDGVIYAILGALSVISLIFVFAKRKAYLNRISAVFADKCNYSFTYYPVFVIITTAIAAIAAIL